LPSQVYLHLYR